MRIFVGHDSRFPEATKTCIKSIRDAGFDGQVDYLCKTKLKDIGFIHDNKSIISLYYISPIIVIFLYIIVLAIWKKLF